MPAKNPEFNPQENIWQFMRDNGLLNRVFDSYDDIVDHCCYGWNQLLDQPWRIMPIGRRQWGRRSDRALRRFLPQARNKPILGSAFS